MATGTGQVFATPFANETSPQLVFNGSGQLALANSGGTSSNDAQFFITTGSPRFLDGGFTIFGQLVAGQNILTDLTQVSGSSVPVSDGTTGSLGNQPTNPITITSSTLSTTNPNGVIHVNATGTAANTLTNVTVTATDTVTNTQTQQVFPVITIPTANSALPTTTTTPPTLNPVSTVSTPANTPTTFQLSATNPTGGQLSYTVQGGLVNGAFTTGHTFATVRPPSTPRASSL